MIHTKEDFFNKVATDIRAWFFPEVAYYRDNENCAAATYTIELFNNGCLTYRTFIGRLAKYCNSNNATIHNFVEKHIISFGEYQYKPKSKWSLAKAASEEVKEGNLISFTESSNADAPVLNGIVEYKDQLGFITVVNGKQYELKRLLNITIINL